jgi:hypothetical protein
MKKLFTYLTVSSFIFILLSCDKPAPTELFDDTDELEIEVITKDLDNQITSGSDTSGITQDLTGVTNLISVSGVKITSKIRTNHLSIAQAMFFDKSNPIRYSDGRILAYKTFTPGTISFNGLEARLDSFKIKYRDAGVHKTVNLGQKYVLYNLLFGYPDPFYFDYDANVSFLFNPSGLGNNISFNIPTPSEIIGSIILEGSRVNSNLHAILRWNEKHERKITVVIGLIRPGQTSSIPIYKFRTIDDGEVIIPGRLLNELPLENFENIVITFIRSNEGYHTNGDNDLLVSSQSIHSIVIDIP